MALDLKAQIFSPDANAADSVTCSDTSKVAVFIYYSPPGKAVKGSFTASLDPDSTYNFEWFKYNNETDSFDISLSVENEVSQSLLDNLSGGGYSVRIRDSSGTDTTFTAWLHIDKLLVTVAKDEDEKLMKSAFTCDYLTLSGAISIDTFYYYDPINHSKVRLKNGFTFLWTSDNKKLKIPNASTIPDPNTTYKPPYLDTWYILTATDSFGMKDVDSVLYESIQIGPDPLLEPWFKLKKFDKEEEKDFIDATPPVQGDAPMKVKFLNESVNGFSYEWIFSDSARSDFFANEFTSDSAYQPEFMYKIPNDYYPALVVTSEAGCIDTFKLIEPITVLPSELEVPNVFSPDGNGTNDYFKVKFQSMKEFSIRIFDRTGKLVYKAEISDMYTWDGWDGKVLDSNRDASAGAYFWVIQATGWDRKTFPKEMRRGVVYLYRQTQ
jgi:gliding motility-associated-like protein